MKPMIYMVVISNLHNIKDNMNINQVLSIFDWTVKWFYKHTKVPQLFVDTYGEYLTYLTVSSGQDVDIIFNHVTSEVIFIDTNSEFYLNQHSDIIVKEYYLKDSRSVDESEMLNILCDINKKEHDGILDLTIDNETLAVIDESANKLNISRQQFIAKVLIDKILGNENV